jgi:hypothetical protein
MLAKLTEDVWAVYLWEVQVQEDNIRTWHPSALAYLGYEGERLDAISSDMQFMGDAILLQCPLYQQDLPEIILGQKYVHHVHLPLYTATPDGKSGPRQPLQQFAMSQWLISAIKMTMGIGTPSSKSKIERMVTPPQSISHHKSWIERHSAVGLRGAQAAK